MRIGIDFDNTLARYDDVFLRCASERGLLNAGFTGGKRAVRDAIRRGPGGELRWQCLQGHVYGEGIAGAGLFDGADAFLRRCRSEHATVLIVSHKTAELRDAALGWMRQNAFLEPERYGIGLEDVYWESTREDKLTRIRALQCTHFIDDLEEVLGHPDFPGGVVRLLLAPDREDRKSVV